MTKGYRKSQEYYQDRRRMMVDLFGGECEFCGSTDKLTFAHIRDTGLRGTSRGSNNRIADVESNPQCYKLLCYPCHMDYDRNQRFANDKVEVDYDFINEEIELMRVPT